MKCVYPMVDWFHRQIFDVSNPFTFSQICGADLSGLLSIELSLALSADKMEAQVPDLEGENLQCGTSPVWGHLKMEHDLQAMMEDDTTSSMRRECYLALVQNALDTNYMKIPSENSLPCSYNSYNCKSWCTKLGTLSSASVPKAEDRNLARLIAKFDSSIEALWNPEDSSEMTEEFREDESDDHLTASPVSMDVHGSKQNLFIACGTNITSSIWSSQPSPEEPAREEWSLPPTVKWSEGDIGRGDSLVVLNHNREDSSFTEVIPRHTPREPYSAPAPPPPALPALPPEPGKEEEDLLTSARTHFIPIRQEAPPRRHHHHQSISYADGTTFDIPTSLERIAFTRSESGTLYLEEDADLDSPPKYMEFKDKKSFDTSNFDSEDDVDFVPKFRLSQNEKCCQTEDEAVNEPVEPGMKPAAGWPGLKRSQEDFYFPGDDQLSVEEGEDEVQRVLEKKQCTKCSGPAWMRRWPPTDWETQPSPQSWYQIWSDGSSKHACDCTNLADSHKSQLRRELSEDGEQLLSDLSTLLDQYGGVLSEINGNIRDHSENLAEYTINYKITRAEPQISKVDNNNWIMDERSTNYGTIQKERKRRYSSSQRACSLFLEGSCRRPHCRFSHDMGSIPCRFWADASCLKGRKCPFLHGGRPVTL